jgi:murein L,D-transpeptidase YcbB/YkuD
MTRRSEQIGLTLQRMRETPLDGLGEFFIRVNIPSYVLQVFEHGKVIRRQRVIVGANKLDDNKFKLLQGHLNRTPMMTTQLYRIEINPDWILPERITKGELIGAVKKDAKYLEKNRIRQTTLANGDVVYYQSAGRQNVLGKVKFLLTESKAIFLHDTRDRNLFRNRRRDFSHGCIRVQEATEFAKYLLVRDGHDGADIDRSLAAHSTQRGITLHDPIPLIIVYQTVELSQEGLPVFLSDVYRYDTAYSDGDLPPMQSTRWGHSLLRPHWVPKVPKETVAAWRAAGKPAPRDLKPK